MVMTEWLVMCCVEAETPRPLGPLSLGVVASQPGEYMV